MSGIELRHCRIDDSCIGVILPKINPLPGKQGDSMDDFAGKSIIVSGGAQGIGRGIVLYLLERNCQVISDIDMEVGWN